MLYLCLLILFLYREKSGEIYDICHCIALALLRKIELRSQSTEVFDYRKQLLIPKHPTF